MKKTTRMIFFFLVPFFANQAFAMDYYFQNSNLQNSQLVFIGDFGFSYRFHKEASNSQEVLEQGLTRIFIQRSPQEPSLRVEQKTRRGFLYLNYKVKNNQWETTSITFRPYETYLKDFGDELECPTPPVEKNRIDLKNISQLLEKETFAAQAFDKTCREKLAPHEFTQLIDATYSILLDGQDALESAQDPEIIKCAKTQSKEGPLFSPFQVLRKKMRLHLNSSSSAEVVKKDPTLPFPLTCDLETTRPNACGETKEGLKDQISLNINCLKKDPQGFQKKTQAVFLHEFAHTLREPNALSEKQVQELEKGHCQPKDVVFASKNEIDLSKNEVIQKLNSEQSGAKTLARDVVNPYASFVETGAPSGSLASAGRGSPPTTPQRNLASVKSSSPKISNIAQYKNTKSYVNTSVNLVARKIAPLVNYVESRAFAETLPPQAPLLTEKSNAAASISGLASETDRNSASPAEVATESPTTSSAAARAKSANSLPGNTRRPAAASKTTTKSSATNSPATTDINLDNAYALKIRKRLLADNLFREELRKKGVRIEFADGYKFESSGPRFQYTEKNGVLVREEP